LYRGHFTQYSRLIYDSSEGRVVRKSTSFISSQYDYYMRDLFIHAKYNKTSNRSRVSGRSKTESPLRETAFLLRPQEGAKYWSGSVCLSVCLSALISQKPHVQTSRNVPYMLPVAVARSSSDDNAICYVLPVVWMTSCFFQDRSRSLKVMTVVG